MQRIKVLSQMTMTKKHILPIVVVTMALFLGGCSSSKQVAYFQNSDTISLASSRGLYNARIMPKDLLTITVSTTDQDAAVPFNLTVPTAASAGNRSSTAQALMQDYLVNNAGEITYPIVGKIHVGGLTKTETEDLIGEKIAPYMSKDAKPIVTVRMSNYKISVLGEVGRPSTLIVGNEQISILEALAQAGDLTIYGKRDNIKLIREDSVGEKHIFKLNLNDANLINSPYYYLQQNDVVYVEPNKAKAQNSQIGSMTSIWFSATSILLSMASLLYNVFKN